MSDLTAENTTIALFPGWCFETLSAAFVTSHPPMTEQQARRFIGRLRDIRLSEVDELEKILGISPTTAEIRREYKSLKRQIERLQNGN